ncbi:hypothetical protein [Nonomuraea pusilla]|uniref:hypothetical protein n=1 Tax=Nonomuraea pusilla TaxID=46177 RepID=UPI0006E1738D|nr:hypothetical protein [Nonomuraea pusilla]
MREIARTVLYEGYLLWPYRQSALKNRHRWTFGGVHPEPYGRANEGHPWLTQAQCLVEADPADTVDVHVRFLHLVACEVARERDGRLEPVPELAVGDALHRPREEAREREVAVAGLDLAELLQCPYEMEIDVPAGQRAEWLGDQGVLLRGWEALTGRVEISAERPLPGVYRLTVKVVNTTPWEGGTRQEAMRRTMMSAHMVMRSEGGGFVSLMDPPEELRQLAAGCSNVGSWPVLVGEEGERHTMLAAPIILYDHPRIAPESPGDLFDATEIDQLLTLSVLALSEQERAEIRGGDPRAREILDRCVSLSPEELMRLHGTMREA